MSGRIVKKISILLTGSIIAQALPLVASPILARMYSPTSFGQFGIYTAVAAILATIANFKYDHAVLLARNSVIAFHVFMFCILTTVIVAIVLWTVFLSSPAHWFASTFLPVSKMHALLLPLGFILAGFTQALVSMLFRTEQFSTVARVRVVQAVVTTVGALLVGISYANGTTLIAASIAGQFVGVCLLLILQVSREPFWTTVRWSLIARCSRRYRRFPMFTAPADLLNSVGANLPMLFIGSTFGLATAGAYSLAQRTVGNPLMLVSSAASDAYRQSAAKSLIESGEYWAITRQMARMLGSIALLPAILCAALAPLLFPIVFGSEWELTGRIVQIMSMVYFLRLVVSPLTYTFYLANRHSEDLLIQAVSLLGAIGIFLYAIAFDVEFTSFLWVYSSALFSIYCVYGLRSLRFAHQSLKQSPATMGIDLTKGNVDR